MKKTLACLSSAASVIVTWNRSFLRFWLWLSLRSGFRTKELQSSTKSLSKSEESWCAVLMSCQRGFEWRSQTTIWSFTNKLGTCWNRRQISSFSERGLAILRHNMRQANLWWLQECMRKHTRVVSSDTDLYPWLTIRSRLLVSFFSFLFSSIHKLALYLTFCLLFLYSNVCCSRRWAHELDSFKHFAGERARSNNYRLFSSARYWRSYW